MLYEKVVIKTLEYDFLSEWVNAAQNNLQGKI